MKATLISEKLKRGIEIVSKIPTKKLALPILENILVRVEKNFLILTSTDLETAITWKTLAKVEKEGKTCVGKKIVESLTSYLPQGNVELTKENGFLEIKTESFLTKIKTENPEEFPIIPQPKEEENIVLDSKKFAEALKKVLNLPSPSLGRPEISGILLSFSSEGAKFVGTDSFRLGEQKLFQKFNLSKDYSLIIPKESAKILVNILSKEEKEMKLYLSPNQIFVETQMLETSEPEVIFTSRLIEGEYPNYEEIVPKKYETEAILNTEEFLKKIKMASIFTSKINEVKLEFLPKENKIKILSENPDLGEFKSEISSQIKGKEMKISFNYKFLMEGIASIEEEKLVFCLTNPEGPAKIQPLEDKSYYYLLMPIKTS